MRALFLIALPPTLAAAFYAAVESWPGFASKELLLGLATFFAFIWAGFALTLTKLTELTALEGLNGRQRETLSSNILTARKKIWRIGLISLLCVLTLFMLSVLTSPSKAEFIAPFAGLSAGFCLDLLFVYRRWSEEIHALIASANARRLDAIQKEEVLNRFPTAS